MKCPSCSTSSLVITERSDIEIDYCPQCRGVWLDRGELDKLIERSAAETKWHRHLDDDDRYKPGYTGYKKRKKGFLGDLFDFD